MATEPAKTGELRIVKYGDNDWRVVRREPYQLGYTWHELATFRTKRECEQWMRGYVAAKEGRP